MIIILQRLPQGMVKVCSHTLHLSNASKTFLHFKLDICRTIDQCLPTQAFENICVLKEIFKAGLRGLIVPNYLYDRNVTNIVSKQSIQYH